MSGSVGQRGTGQMVPNKRTRLRAMEAHVIFDGQPPSELEGCINTPLCLHCFQSLTLHGICVSYVIGVTKVDPYQCFASE